MVEPDSILDDFRRESVTFIQIRWIFHPAILKQTELTCQYPTIVRNNLHGTDAAQ
jgi:hypothetical protein